MPGRRPATALLIALLLAGCGGSSSGGVPPRTTNAVGSSSTTPGATTAGTTTVTRTTSPPPAPPQVLAAASAGGVTPFVAAARWRGQVAVYVARSASGVTLLSFQQRLTTLHLHSGTTDAGTGGWRWGPSIAESERGRILAAFNGGFRLSTGAGGFQSYGRTAVPLSPGKGSIVTYRDGTTDIGVWQHGVPAAGSEIASVRQNLTLLVDGGRAALNTGCLTCWGATLGGVAAPARSALGITADGHLIWAGGEHLTVAALVQTLLAARVVRAIELDINPEWVAAYLYAHHGHRGPLTPVPMLAGQTGIPGQYLLPWGRDFFTVVAR